VETFILEMKKYLSLIFGLLLLSGCSQLTMLSVAGSTASLVVNNNALVKAYSGVDVVTFMVTEKDIKTHVYEKAKDVKKIVKKTFILEKPSMLKSEKRVLVSFPIIKVKIEDIEWEIENKEWYKIYYSSKFKLFY